MERIRIKVTPRLGSKVHAVLDPDLHIRRAIAKLILFASVSAALFWGLFPFDFIREWFDSFDPIRNRFRFALYDQSLTDLVQNILFFTPMGLAIAMMVPAKARWTTWLLFAGVTLLVGLALSVTIECLQAYLPVRDSSIVDVMTNAGGAAATYLLYWAFGRFVMPPAVAGLRLLSPLLNRWTLAAATVAVAGLGLALPIYWGRAGGLDTWDPRFHLSFGGEVMTQQRDWRGTIYEFAIASRAAGKADVEAIFRNADLNALFPDRLQAHYQFGGPGPFSDRAGKLDPVNWDKNAPPPNFRQDGSTTDWENWIHSRGSVVPLSTSVRNSSEFTAVLVAETSWPEQYGPARIVSLAIGTIGQNLVLGQQRDDFAIRLRAPFASGSGQKPELLVEDVFLAHTKRKIVVVYSPMHVRIYVDNADDLHELKVSPEAAILWRLWPRSNFTYRVSEGSIGVAGPIYRILFFTPFAVALAMTARISRPNVSHRWWLIAIGALIVIVAMELAIVSVSHHGFHWVDVIASAGACVLGTSLVHVRSEPS